MIESRTVNASQQLHPNEKRTQVAIVLGFIIIPVLSLSALFMVLL